MQQYGVLVNLLPEGAALSESSLSACGLAEHHGAISAHDNGLRMRKYCGDDIAARALYIHEVRVRGLYQPLQLVLSQLGRAVRVQQIGLKSLGLG